jgi:hypothetical protein
MIPALKRLWSQEPVLVATVPAILVTVGVISATQADALTAAVSSIVAAAGEIVAAVGARSQVTPSPAKPATQLAGGPAT